MALCLFSRFIGQGAKREERRVKWKKESPVESGKRMAKPLTLRPHWAVRKEQIQAVQVIIQLQWQLEGRERERESRANCLEGFRFPQGAKWTQRHTGWREQRFLSPNSACEEGKKTKKQSFPFFFHCTFIVLLSFYCLHLWLRLHVFTACPSHIGFRCCFSLSLSLYWIPWQERLLEFSPLPSHCPFPLSISLSLSLLLLFTFSLIIITAWAILRDLLFLLFSLSFFPFNDSVLSSQVTCSTEKKMWRLLINKKQHTTKSTQLQHTLSSHFSFPPPPFTSSFSHILSSLSFTCASERHLTKSETKTHNTHIRTQLHLNGFILADRFKLFLLLFISLTANLLAETTDGWRINWHQERERESERERGMEGEREKERKWMKRIAKGRVKVVEMSKRSDGMMPQWDWLCEGRKRRKGKERHFTWSGRRTLGNKDKTSEAYPSESSDPFLCRLLSY